MKQFSVGQKVSFSKTISEKDVNTFAEISGDHNPLHLNAEYAKTTRFGARIAHGALTAGLISAAIGNDLPGVGSIYMSQSTKFVKPVYFDDTITATVEISAIRTDKGIITLKTDCKNQRGEIVAEGEAVIFHPDAKSSS
jgi:3-hydroxybutyryl-CoA dehydratase